MSRLVKELFQVLLRRGEFTRLMLCCFVMCYFSKVFLDDREINTEILKNFASSGL